MREVTENQAVTQTSKTKINPKTGLPTAIYNNFAFEFFNALFWQSLGAPLLLFIRQSGGSALMLGLTSALPLVMMPITLATSRQVEKFGYRRTAITFWTARWVFSSSMILIALLNFPGFDQWRVPLAFLVLLVYHLCRNLGVSGWFPWTTAIIPIQRRGLYLSRTTLFANLGSIGTYLTVGAILGSNPSLTTFALVFTFGTLGGFMSTIFMLRIARPENERSQGLPQTRVSFWKSLQICFARPGFRTFVIIQTFYGVAFFGIPTLSLIYLREKVGIAPGLILLFSTLGVIGASLTSGVWGRWIDRRQEVNSLQLLAFAGLCLNSLFWLPLQFLPVGFNYVVAALLMSLSAVWISALNLSQSHSIMALAPRENIVMFQNIAFFMTYCSQALAPTLWGLLLDTLGQARFELNLGFSRFGPYQIFFMASVLIGLAGVFFIISLLRQKKMLSK